MDQELTDSRNYVFSGRYKAFIVDGSGNDYLKTACDYVLWIAKAEVPADEVQSTVSKEELEQNLDPKGRRK